MDRRTFLAGSLGVATAIAMPKLGRAANGTPVSGAGGELPVLEITLTDTGFELKEPITAGRYHVNVSNSGTLTDSHFALGKIPDEVTDAQYDEWLKSEGEDTEALTFEKIGFVGVPDWPQPGETVSGVIDLEPGRYFLFDPFDARGHRTVMIEGEFVPVAEPASDLTVMLREMEIVLPETAFTTAPVRWEIENAGAMSHEVAIIPVSPDFTEEHLQILISLPEEATPPADIPQFIYQPVAAIGILAQGHTSWLDVALEPGRYLAACMLPFGTGYPHAFDGMYRFFAVE